MITPGRTYWPEDKLRSKRSRSRSRGVGDGLRTVLDRF